MMKPKRPNEDQISLAISWLRANEGVEGEAEACGAVADWLEWVEREDAIRSAARKGGVPVAALRRKLAENSKGG